MNAYTLVFGVMIVTGGRQVAPIEVESVLCAHPDVAEACVSVTTFVDPPQADRASPATSAHAARKNLMPALSR